MHLRKIRSESLVAKAITVFVRTSPFQRDYGYYSNAKTIDFPIATNNSIETVKTAVSILESIFKNGCRYQKAGVMLTGLRNDDGRKNLFSSEKDEKIKSLMRSIDNTNYRYGRSTLSLASAGVHKKWNMRRQYSSKIDTADFYCLPTVKVIELNLTFFHYLLFSILSPVILDDKACLSNFFWVHIFS